MVSRRQSAARSLKSRRSTRSSSSRRTTVKGGFLRALFTAVFATMFIAGLLWWLFWVVVPQLLPLNSTEVIVLVPASSDESTNQIILAQFDPQAGKITAGMIQPESATRVIGGYGEYPIRALYPLLAMENKSEQYQRAAHSWALSVLVDQVVPTSESLSTQPLLLKKYLVAELKQQLRHSWHRPARFQEWLALYFFVKDTPAEKFHWSTQKLVVGELGKTFTSSRHSSCPMAIVNTTPTSGIASRLTQLVEARGSSVVRVTDTGEKHEKSSIVINQENPECGIVAKQLLSAFPAKIEIIPNEALLAEHRAEAVVLLGLDVAEEIGDQRR